MRRGSAFISQRSSTILVPGQSFDPGGQLPRSLTLYDPELGELALECSEGYIVTSLELGFPTVREVLFEMAYTDGIWDETAYYGASGISIGLALDGAKKPVQLLLDQLRSYVLPSRRPRLRYLPNGYTTPREMVLRGYECRAVFDNPRVMEVIAQWVNPDGRSYEYLPDSPNGLRCVTFGFDQPGGRIYSRSYDWQYPAGLTNAVLISNAGNASSSWEMTIFGPVSTPVIDMIHLGSTFSIDLNRGGALVVPADGWVKIDSERRTITDSSGASLYSKVENASLPALPPGETTLRARASDSDPPAQVEFCYRSAWV